MQSTNDSKRSEWMDKVTHAMHQWAIIYQCPQYICDDPDRYVNGIVNALLTDAGSTVRRKWDECCDRVVFQTRFWPTLADLQKVADELTHNEGPNI
jgi:hypothetical protein